MAAEAPVVIVGAGLAGILTAKQLVKAKIPVTLIHSSTFFEWPIAGSHSVTHPQDHGKAVSGGTGHHVAGANNIVGVAQGITDTEVLLDQGRKLPYSAVVVCVGMNMGIITPEVGQAWSERKSIVERCGRAIKTAKTILIGGAGLVAIETAGAAREENANARILLMVRGKGPLEDGTYSAKYTEKLKKQLAIHKIEVVANSEVKEMEPCFEAKEYQLGSGPVTADVYLPAFNQGFRAGFLGEAANARGQVRVNEFQQSVSNSKMFAVGCSDKQSLSMYMKIDAEASHLASNMKLLKAGKAMKPFKDSGPGALTMKIGHLYAWIQYENLPPGPCLKCCGFPFCVCCCCAGHPFALGMCCGDPEGKGTADLLKSALLHSTGMSGIKGLNTPPVQEKM